MKKNHTPSASPIDNAKLQDLEKNREYGEGQFITTDHGVRINNDHNSLKAGERGPSLLEDFIMREKITHFDHERIPERIVHARGSGAHGYFEAYGNVSQYTKAVFLNDTSVKTPVFVRFSTVAGFKGSTDLARDVRGFAVKFYTQEGNFDLVGNNIPVFFIQDAMKFPDLIHAVKPEPHNEIPQAASAHDTFWDFISLMPESMHMVMWAMSDRAIPRSLRMMEGFGIHTFRLVNENNESVFVKFHWKPKLGTHAVVWDEALKISGNDPDFHRRDLWEAIENGNFPEWELGVQIVPEADEHKYNFDLLDPTKLIPEELVPVTKIGRMVLNRNPDNFFAETEQVAFHPGHVVPGIDFSNDPLLQGRLFSYTDTQLSRLGSPNFHEIPINRTIAPMHNNQRDGHMRQEINVGRVSYSPNSLNNGYPAQAKESEGGFVSVYERVEAHKVRERSESFADHFSHAALFFKSQTPVEQNHIISALRFELSKVETIAIRQRMLGLLSQVDNALANKVAEGLGLAVPAQPEKPMNHGIGADADPQKHEPKPLDKSYQPSDALSMLKNPTVTDTIETRQVAFLCADGVSEASVNALKKALEAKGASAKIIGPHAGNIKTDTGKELKTDFTFFSSSSVVFDAVYIPGAANMAPLESNDNVIEFINDAYRHCKVIGADDGTDKLLSKTTIGNKLADKKEKTLPGIVMGSSKAFADEFISELGKHRIWERESKIVE
ncbi:catalase [Flavobacterium sp. DG1-102-2]|uniref:catalase n=1 Tax=Flavobacterium sp. DG1-102-2 TaxID=3081663 RepID=UPI00294A43C1|nr:catalase [Flavobacterium sp. DG1-102-2]MDV6167162.1 catalase [Flavobacterium sp. DG1-102-2]